MDGRRGKKVIDECTEQQAPTRDGRTENSDKKWRPGDVRCGRKHGLQEG